MTISLGTFLMLAIATAGIAASTFAVQARLRMFLFRDPVPEEAYRHLGLWMGLQMLFVGILIGLCLINIPVVDSIFG